MCVCLKFFWCVIFGSLIAEKNLSCVRCKHSFKELKYIKLFYFARSLKTTKILSILLSRSPISPRRKGVGVVGRLKKATANYREIQVKRQKSFVNLHYLWTLRYRIVIFVNSFGDYVAMVSFKTHIQISCARSYLAQCLFVSNFGSNFDGKKVTSRQKIMQAVFCSLAPPLPPPWGGNWYCLIYSPVKTL